MFSFGGTAPALGTPSTQAPTSTASSFNFGGMSTGQPVAQSVQPAQQSSLQSVSSFSTHPFQYIQQCYDQNSLNYRFRTYFYNAVDGGTAKYPMNKPANISDRLWTQILNDNPDPQKMIPIIANGFEDLKSRAAWQDEQMAAQSNKIGELEGRLAALMKKADLETTSQLQQIQKQQLKLISRILTIMKIFECHKRAGHKLQPHEEALKSEVQGLLAKLNQTAPLDPASMRAMRFQLQALQEVDRLDPLQSCRHLALEDSAGMDAIKAILAEQQKGIQALTQTLTKDSKDLEIMRYGFQV